MRALNRLRWYWRNPDLASDALRGIFVCSWRGHAWRSKMRDMVCERCSASRPL